ncbi:MAG TPA: NFACT RNA binding domain-containing protein [bacterium]|nr:NFACT RNA binding domain-containing protein [bacterium]
MFLSELIQTAAYISENANGAIVSAIYRSNGGTLIKLYGANIGGIFFSTSEKILIPVSDPAHFKKEPLTRLEEGLRANFSGRINRVSVMEQFGKVVRIESYDRDLIIPLFNGQALFIASKDGNVIWSEKKDSGLEPLKEPMRHYEPVTAPQDWEKRFFEEMERKAGIKKEQYLAEKIRKLQKLAGNLESQIAKYTDDISKYGKLAPLIKANLSLISPAVRTNDIEVFDTDGQKKKIQLDPSKTVLENMELFFNKVRKAKKGLELTQKRLAETLWEIENSAVAIPEDNGSLPVNRKKAEKNRQHVPYHEYRTDSGKIFLVGKEARDNDELTFKISSPHDMWFHAKDHHGSHVILKMKKGEEMTGADLLNGCLLALYYSKAKKGMSGEVWYTERKNVMKKKGLPAGKVIIKNAKVKYINNGTMPEGLKKTD